MDQSYLLRSSENPAINEMGLLQFRKAILGDQHLAASAIQGVSDLVTEKRTQSPERADSIALRGSIGTFHDLGVYTTMLEPALVQLSSVYFKSWAAEQTSQGDIALYLKRTSDLIKREMLCCERYDFDRSTRKLFSDLIDEILIRQQLHFLTEKDSLLDLFESNDIVALAELYKLLQRVGKNADISPAFQAFIVDEGSSIVFDEKRESEMVVRLLELKQRLDRILKAPFQGNHTLSDAMHKSVEQFINQTKKTASTWGTDNPKPGEMIAKHVDALLKGGLKAIPTLAASAKSDTTKPDEGDEDDAMLDEDVEINKQLDLVLDLFRFVHGKAVFEAFYKKDLARRLLMGRSASNDAERSMLARLKNGKNKSFMRSTTELIRSRVWSWFHS